MLNRKYRQHKFSEKYSDILEKFQDEQNDLYWEMHQDNAVSNLSKRKMLTSYAMKFLKDNAIELEDYTREELATKLVDDIEFYSVLTTALDDPDVEGININGYNNIRVTFRNGTNCKIDSFQNQTHAIDVMKRLLLVANVTMDEAIPMAEASLRWTDGRDIRVTALQSPAVDNKTAGVCGYIRKLGSKVFTKEEYLQGDFASDNEIKLLELLLLRGISILIVGKVNTGKTTFLNYLMSTLPNDLQLVTIETGAREINLLKYDEKGNVISNAVHLLTRKSNIEDQNVTQEKLLEKVLRLNADVVAVAEMRDVEAYAAQEASLVGTAVISTTHAGSPRQAHERVAELCRKRYPTDMKTALVTAQKAFPIVAFIHALPSDGRRRIMNLSECVVRDEKTEYRTLYEFKISSGSHSSVLGYHKLVNRVSDELIEDMKIYGLTEEEEYDLRGGEKII